jgi:hypothetical protein
LPVRKRKASKENFSQTPKRTGIIRLPIAESDFKTVVSDHQYPKTKQK